MLIVRLSGLNPYYIGSYSMSMKTNNEIFQEISLNPYYIGSYSMSRILLVDYVVLYKS